MSTLSSGQTDLASCASLQHEELEVLESIHPDSVSSGLSDRSLKLEISIEWGEPKRVIVVDESKWLSSVPDRGSASVTQGLRLSLSTLPPLQLHILLPPTYPLHVPPEIVSLCATHSWLPQEHIRSLQQSLLSLWSAGNVVLYDWIEYIRDAQFLKLLGLSSAEGVLWIPHAAPHLLIPILTQYDSVMKYAKFSQNVYLCSICFAEHKGARCIQLLCSHIFCHTCLNDFWKLCIVEGEVERVGCPDPGCVKEGREATEEEVIRVVTEEEVRRWRWLKEKRALEKDPTIVHCPLSFCQTAIPKPAGEETEGYDKLRTCDRCGFSFCAICKRSWHGPLVECEIETLAAEYSAFQQNSPERALMEQRYGVAKIKKLVARYEEEQSNRKWLESSTMACPGCLVHVEKSQGCNHMTCSKCKQHFCYLCGKKLNGSHPYQHFSDEKLSCYLKLFDLRLNGEWQPVEAFDDL